MDAAPSFLPRFCVSRAPESHSTLRVSAFASGGRFRRRGDTKCVDISIGGRTQVTAPLDTKSVEPQQRNVMCNTDQRRSRDGGGGGGGVVGKQGVSSSLLGGETQRHKYHVHQKKNDDLLLFRVKNSLDTLYNKN